jgi:excisionase family DNA binding protein
MSKQLLRDREVAEMLGVHKVTVWRMASAGTLPKPVKFGHNSRWHISEIDAYLATLMADRPTSDVEAVA